jgi:hypothetical protein
MEHFKFGAFVQVFHIIMTSLQLPQSLSVELIKMLFVYTRTCSDDDVRNTMFNKIHTQLQKKEKREKKRGKKAKKSTLDILLSKIH